MLISGAPKEITVDGFIIDLGIEIDRGRDSVGLRQGLEIPHQGSGRRMEIISEGSKVILKGDVTEKIQEEIQEI